MTIGATLAAARESAGLSLQDVSDRTRIRSAVIVAIEADDFRLCGGDVYARGHVQSLARTSGIDPVPLLAEFDAAHPRDNAPSPTELAELDNRDIRDGWTPNWGAAVAAVLVLLVSFGWSASSRPTPARGGRPRRSRSPARPPRRGRAAPRRRATLPSRRPRLHRGAWSPRHRRR